MAKFKMAAIITLSVQWISLSQIEIVWVRVLCKMAEFKMAEFKMAAIIKLIRLIKFESESEWSESVFE